MSVNKTSIEWTHYSASPIRYRDLATGKDVWACVKCSPGCSNCYAEAIGLRFRRALPFTVQNIRKVEPYFCEKTARELLRSKRMSGKRCFIGDMTDVFGPWVPFDLIDKMFAVFALRPDVTFQVLTKRPERMAEYASHFARGGDVWRAAIEFGHSAARDTEPEVWPLPNVWCGTSVEDQQRADERIPHLMKCPAIVRFVSAEPLLSPVDLHWLGLLPNDAACLWDAEDERRRYLVGPCERLPMLDWVIIGCLSLGSRAGSFDGDYFAAAESINEQCRAAGVPVFNKQIPINGRVSHDPLEWPINLRAREFPDVRSQSTSCARETTTVSS